jgi:hypothetical protein
MTIVAFQKFAFAGIYYPNTEYGLPFGSQIDARPLGKSGRANNSRRAGISFDIG